MSNSLKKRMTNEEAIRMLESMRISSNNSISREKNEAIDIAIEALGKQIKKEPVFKPLCPDNGKACGYEPTEEKLFGFFCPCCGKILMNVHLNNGVCKCGQKLSWEDE